MDIPIKGSIVLITGGTGTFGAAFLEKCIREGAKEVRIFSRVRTKQQELARRFPSDIVRYYTGDIQIKPTLYAAMTGVDLVIHAAAMKHLPSCEQFPSEAARTNITGSKNVISAAIRNRVKKVVCISTDKAVYPTSTMGLGKAYMEKLALQMAEVQTETEICVVRFSNVIGSCGSVIPLFINQVRNGQPITITDPGMTRFMMTVDDAVELVARAAASGENGEILVRKSPVCTIQALAMAVCKYMGRPADYPIQIIGPRPGERIHESLMTDEEAERAVVKDDYFVISRKEGAVGGIGTAYRSQDALRLNEEALAEIIRLGGFE